jgi:hypothetical protein
VICIKQVTLSRGQRLTVVTDQIMNFGAVRIYGDDICWYRFKKDGGRIGLPAPNEALFCAEKDASLDSLLAEYRDPVIRLQVVNFVGRKRTPP